MRNWMANLSVFSVVGLCLAASASAGEIPCGRTETVERAEAIVPVAAWGTAEPAQRITIKSKLSGRIQDVFVQEGDMVRAGSTLAQLNPCDEARAVERLRAELDRARAMHQQALLRYCDAIENRPLDVESVEKTVDEVRTHREELQIDVDKLGELSPDVKSTTEETKAGIALHRAAAALARAEVDLKRMRNYEPLSIAQAQEDVAASEALVRSTQTQLDDARQRLADTTITAPIDAMISSVDVHNGEVIQSGMAGQCGGSVLMQLVDVAKMYVMAPVDSDEIGAIRFAAPECALPGHTHLSLEKEPAKPAPAKGKDTPPKPAKGLVKIIADAYPNENFDGIIDRVLPEPQRVAEETIFSVRIRLMGPDVSKLLGLPVHVDFQIGRKKNLLRVPNDALVNEGGSVFVYVDVRDNPTAASQKRKVRVRLGTSDDRYSEVRSGLKMGDRVWVRQPPPLAVHSPSKLAGSSTPTNGVVGAPGIVK